MSNKYYLLVGMEREATLSSAITATGQPARGHALNCSSCRIAATTFEAI